MNCLRQAVFHGADAVYLACKNFGARKFATNFTNDEIVEAIRFCHLYGVKLYVTMNTLVHNSEVDSFLEQVRFLHRSGVDALIVQDFGMICLLREMFPNLDIHASTQANNSSVDICRLFYGLGVKRVIFSRELSIEEIDAIDVPIEKEAFIHGALCVSYSGCCLMSSMLGGRSGNRGECAGCCRLPYSLKKDGKVIQKNQYLLSMKELNTSSQIKRLLNSSVYSFKIEGRMKGPLYVGFITDFYRKLIDGVEIDFDKMTSQLKTIFNREFTLGHLFHADENDIINSLSPNHIGLEIGKVSIKKDKIKIILNDGCELHQHDSIRFLHSNKGMVVNYLYDSNMRLCNSSKDVCYVDNKVDLNGEDVLTKTQDCLLEKEYILEESARKVPICFDVVAKKGRPLVLKISDGVHARSLEGDIVAEAKTAPIDEAMICEKLSRVGGTPFTVENINIDMDSNIFIPMKNLNEMRRELVEKLVEERQMISTKIVENEVSFSPVHYDNIPSGLTCMVYNEEQLKTCLDMSFVRIYVMSKDLYDKYKGDKRVYYSLDRCVYSPSNCLSEKNIVSDFMNCEGALVFGSYPLNITNIYTGYYLQKYGYKNIFLSVELSQNEIQEFVELYREKFGYANFEMLSYGRVENMIIKGNICKLNDHDLSYRLVDSKGRSFPIFYDGRATHIYHSEVREDFSCTDSNMSKLFVFLDEKPSDIAFIVKNNSN